MNSNIKKIAGAFLAVITLSVSIPFSCISKTASATYDFKTSCDYMYNELETDAEKNFYNALLKACNEVDDNSEYYTQTPYAPLTGINSKDRAVEVAWLFFYDHPEFFWLKPNAGIHSIYGFTFQVYTEYQNGSKRAATKKQIVEVASNYINNALKFDTQYDKAKYLHDALLDDITYNEGEFDQSIVSAFLEKNTVCAGFSGAYSMLCNAVGIDSVTITSIVHGWNAVKIGTHWFLVDVTNDKNSYRFFLLSDDEMHDWDLKNSEKYYKTVTENGKDITYVFYAHDIDSVTYKNYWDDFPDCTISYEEYLKQLSEIPKTVIGDVNNDKKTDARDATLILKHYAEFSLTNKDLLTNDQKLAANVNKDNSTDARDATIILQYYAHTALGGKGTIEDFI